MTALSDRRVMYAFAGLMLGCMIACSPAKASEYISPPQLTNNTVGIESTGEGSVGINGNAEYRYAVPLPDGINGFTPRLSISYNSDVKRSSMGYSWTLSGASTISRCGATYFADNQAGAVDGDTGDKFCLNGMRLINVSGDYGQSESEYRTLSDTYQKVVLHHGIQTSDSWFEVWDAKGGRSEFRQTLSLSNGAPLSWHQTKKVDLAGNSIDYQYSSAPSVSDSRLYLSKISYSGFDVSVNYDNRQQTSRVYQAGRAISDTQRVDSITVSKKQSSSPFLTVSALYSTRSDHKDMLDKVTVRRNSGTAVTAFDVDWAEQGNQSFVNYKRVQSGDFSSTQYAVREVADVNGDGFPDFIGFAYDGVYVALSDGQKFQAASRWSTNYGGKDKWTTEHVRKVMDVNGDGMADIVGFGNAGVYVSLSTGAGFSAQEAWLSTFGNSQGWSSTSHVRTLADVNGDGLVDVVAFGNAGVYVSLGTGTGFLAQAPWLGKYGSRQSWSNSKHIRTLADVNGDGMADVVGFGDSAVYVSLSNGASFAEPVSWIAKYVINQGWTVTNHIRTLSDVNGDGMADIVGFTSSGAYVSLSTGNSFTPQKFWLGSFGNRHGWSGTEDVRTLSDINADGLADIVGFKDNEVSIALSSGVAFEGSTSWASTFSSGAANWDKTKDLRVVTDIDGDGQGDILGASAKGLYTAQSQFSPPRVGSVTSALGNVVSYSYGQLTDPNVYRLGDKAVYPQRSVRKGTVVTSIRHSDGLGGVNELQYKYEGKRRHLMGVGNLGFAKVHEWSKTRNRVVSKLYHQNVDNTLLYSALKEKTVCQLSTGANFGFDSCGTTSSYKVKRVVNTWQTEKAIGTQAASPHSGNGTYQSPFVAHQRYKQQLVRSVTQDWDLAGTLLKTVTVAKTYNKWYGHTLTQTTTTQDHIHGTETVEATTNTYKTPNTSKWLVNLLEKQTIQVSGTGLYSVDGRQTFDKVFDYEYNSQGLLTRSYQQKGTSLETSTALSSFDRGLPRVVTEYWSPALSQHIQKNGAQVTSRTSQYEYDSFGYTSKTINTLGQTFTTVYDPVIGELVSSTGIDGNTTTYYFDDWGRALGFNGPTGAWQRIQYQIDNSDGFAYQQIVSSNTQPAETYWFDSKHRERKSRVATKGGYSYQHKRYNQLGLLIASTIPSKNEGRSDETLYTYDAFDRVASVVEPNSDTTSYRYSGFSTEVTNSESQTTTTQFNALGQKVRVTDDTNNSVDYVYDGWGNLTRTIDPRSNKILIEYNALGHRTSMNDPDMGMMTYKTNGLGEVYQTTSAGGITVSHYYDVQGRKIKTIDPETPGGKHWVYNSKGQLEKAYQSGYFEGYTYYPNGLLKEKAFSLLGQTHRQTYYYDANGLQEKLDYGNNVVATYEYDSLNILSKVYLSESGTGVKGTLIWSLSAMDAFGNQTDITYGNGLRNRYSYDAITGYIDATTIGTLSGSTTILTQNFDFDSIGNLVYRKEQVNHSPSFAGAAHHFSTLLEENIIYDNLNRIGTVTTNTSYLGSISSAARSNLPGVVTVDYDVLGNIRYKSDVGTYHYDGTSPHAVSRVSGATNSTMSYDARGNMLSGMGRVISGYTSFNKPLEISKGGNTTRFKYGVHNQRYERIDVTNAGTTHTTYLDSTEIIRQPNGQTTFRYYVGDFAIHEKTLGSATSKGIRYLHKDHLGSVIAISDKDGQIEQRFSYDAWGKRREPSLGMSVSERGRIGFTGHEMLDEVGLIHMNGRVYDPTLGRFLSADPFIQDEWFGTQAFNRFSYVQNNPLSYTDPSGHLSESLGGGQCTVDNADDPVCAGDSGHGDSSSSDGHSASGNSDNQSVANNHKELGEESQGWSWGSFLDGVNLTLDFIGQVPAIGIGADLLNAGIYLARGQGVNAAISAAAAVPGLGNAATAGRIAGRVAEVTNKGLGATRKSVREYLNKIEGVPREQLAKDLEKAGFKKVFDGNGMQHFQRGKWKVRIDPPHGKTNYNHMHINRGGNKNAFDKNLKPVSHKSPDAHLPIQ